MTPNLTLPEIEAFLIETGMTAMRLSMMAFRRPHEIAYLRTGKTITLDASLRLTRAMAVYNHQIQEAYRLSNSKPLPDEDCYESNLRKIREDEMVIRGSKDLLNSLWREHPGIIAHLTVGRAKR